MDDLPSINFLLALHNHQPVGNFDFVIEDAYEKAPLSGRVLLRFTLDATGAASDLSLSGDGEAVLGPCVEPVASGTVFPPPSVAGAKVLIGVRFRAD